MLTKLVNPRAKSQNLAFDKGLSAKPYLLYKQHEYLALITYFHS